MLTMNSHSETVTIIILQHGQQWHTESQ